MSFEENIHSTTVNAEKGGKNPYFTLPKELLKALNCKNGQGLFIGCHWNYFISYGVFCIAIVSAEKEEELKKHPDRTKIKKYYLKHLHTRGGKKLKTEDKLRSLCIRPIPKAILEVFKPKEGDSLHFVRMADTHLPQIHRNIPSLENYVIATFDRKNLDEFKPVEGYTDEEFRKDLVEIYRKHRPWVPESIDIGRLNQSKKARKLKGRINLWYNREKGIINRIKDVNRSIKFVRGHPHPNQKEILIRHNEELKRLNKELQEEQINPFRPLSEVPKGRNPKRARYKIAINKKEEWI